MAETTRTTSEVCTTLLPCCPKGQKSQARRKGPLRGAMDTPRFSLCNFLGGRHGHGDSQERFNVARRPKLPNWL